MNKNLLITGIPGVGKTTLIRKLASQLDDHNPVGFYTEEIREKGIRQGFSLVSFSGERGILAHVNIAGRQRVGKYGVDMAGFEDFLERMPFFEESTKIIIIDEIGKMECFSQKFKTLLVRILDSGKIVLASIAQKGGGLIGEIKLRGDVIIFEITLGNRETIAGDILYAIRPMLNGSRQV